MKEITEQERQAIEEAAYKYLERIADDNAPTTRQESIRRLINIYKNGAEFALSELRKPSEDSEFLKSDNGKKLIEFLYGKKGDEHHYLDSECSKKQYEAKPSEDLVEQIVEIFGFNNRHDHFSGIWEQQFKDVATEIANLAPFQVNVELLEFVKSIAESPRPTDIFKYNNFWLDARNMAKNIIQNTERSKQ